MNKNKAIKTCGECRYMLHKDTFEVCTLCMTETSMFDAACEHFTPPTNGDKIRQMSDEELVATIEELSLRFSGKSEFINWLKQEA